MKKVSILLGGIMALTGCTSPAVEPQSPPLPNLVLILADDLGYGDPVCYNPDSRVPTPAIDSLAAAGMLFTDAHSPSSVCTPTRYGLLTGRYSWRSRLKDGVLWGYSRSLIEAGRLTVPSLLKRHGYQTAVIGKWHLGFQPFEEGRAEEDQKVDYSRPLSPGAAEAGFDYFFGIPASLDMEPYLYVENDRPLAVPTEQVEASEHRRRGGGGFWRAGPIAPGFRHHGVLDRLKEKALEFLDRQTAGGSPFFLYLPLTAPHTPWLPGDQFRGKSGAGYYGDFVVQVDELVGEVLSRLEANRQADNTLVIFTSDNGAHWLPADIEQFGHRANGGLRGQKADIHEGGHRVPFIARWPGRIAAASRSEETICLTDLLATCAALVGETLPEGAGEDSFNLLPLLLGEPSPRPLRPFTVHHSSLGLFAVRRGPWKLIEGLGSGGFTEPRTIEPEPGNPAGQLFNLAEDPAEEVNLYDQHPEVVAELSALLRRHRESGTSR